MSRVGGRHPPSTQLSTTFGTLLPHVSPLVTKKKTPVIGRWSKADHRDPHAIGRLPHIGQLRILRIPMRTPLATYLLNARLPCFKMSSLERYNGTGDLDERVQNYKTTMKLHGANEPLLCMAFHTILQKSAKDLFLRDPYDLSRICPMFFATSSCQARRRRRVLQISFQLLRERRKCSVTISIASI